MALGPRFVTTFGAHKMPWWCVDNWAIQLMVSVNHRKHKAGNGDVCTGAEALRNAYFGVGHYSQEILLDGVECTGTESRLLDCPHPGLNIHNCGHQEDAGVRCTQPPGKCPHTSDVLKCLSPSTSFPFSIQFLNHPLISVSAFLKKTAPELPFHGTLQANINSQVSLSTKLAH